VAQEIDRDYNASVECVVIPNAWVRASIDAHLVLGIKPTGARTGALDVADEGTDMNAFCGAYGIVVEQVQQWSGKGSDIFDTVKRVFTICDVNNFEGFKYDADGLGAGVRGDARILNEKRTKKVSVDAFRGSEAVHRPEGEDIKGRKNKDYFANRKAQAWWALRTRFQNTYRAVVEGHPYDPEDLISISSMVSDLQKVISELSQPTYSQTNTGKLLIDKAPDGQKSPNLADCIMIQFAQTYRKPTRINPSAINRARGS
jgi:phage terminase large subunit